MDVGKIFVGEDVMAQQRRFVGRQTEQAGTLPVRKNGAAGHGYVSFGKSVVFEML
jgi:hypothetical protein